AVRTDPGANTLAASLRALSGVKVVSDGGSVVDVKATSGQLAAIAAVPNVEWVASPPTWVPMNRDARWVTDTGVRDLYDATGANGTTSPKLTGAGQTAGDADTAMNYYPDQNGRAHIAFRDCSDAAGKTCKLADYTQKDSGTDT